MIYDYYKGVANEHISKLLVITAGIIFAVGATVALTGSATAENHCEQTDAGTANYVNEAPSEPFTVTCDIGIYFNEDGKVNGADILGTTETAMPTQYGVYVDGADVDVVDSNITVDDDYANQFVGITYQNEATGKIKSNELTGAFRAAVVVRGENTEVDVLRNTISGTGASTDGWAENGVQVDQGAVADIVNNHIEGFWWDKASYGSTAILLYGSGSSSVINNDVIDSEFAIYVVGDGNQVKGNDISAAVESSEASAYGALLAGNKNKLAGNSFRAEDGAVGVYFFPGSEKNRLTGNRVNGFAYPTSDAGDNIVKGLVTPVQ